MTIKKNISRIVETLKAQRHGYDLRYNIGDRLVLYSKSCEVESIRFYKGSDAPFDSPFVEYKGKDKNGDMLILQDGYILNSK